MTAESICGTQLYNCVNDPVLCFGLLQIQLKAFVNSLVKLLQLLTVTSIKARPDFPQNPHCHLDDEICGSVLAEQFFHLLDDLFSKLVRLLVVFHDQMQEIVHDAWGQVFAAQFEENLHCFEVPLVGG